MKKKYFNTSLSIENLEKLDQAINNKICLCGNYLTKSSIIDLALNLFFMELEEKGINELALKLLQNKE